MSINGQPSASDMAKAAAAGDGVGTHRHGPFAEHQHGDPKFTDAEVAFMESKGNHVDRYHGLVYSATGGLWTPLHVAAMLREARRQGALRPQSSEPGNSAVEKGVSGPGESMPTVQRLDLRQQP
jgi:hypothetical protein